MSHATPSSRSRQVAQLRQQLHRVYDTVCNYATLL